MNINTLRFPLDHLLECSRCGTTMHLNDSPEPHYTCQGRSDKTNPCGTPALKAMDLNRFLIGEVMPVVITDSTLPAFRQAVGGALAKVPAQTQWGDDELMRVATDPEWVMANGQESETAAVLAQFIARIRVQPGSAMVEYSISLPTGTPLAGSLRQDISLPDSIIV